VHDRAVAVAAVSYDECVAEIVGRTMQAVRLSQPRPQLFREADAIAGRYGRAAADVRGDIEARLRRAQRGSASVVLRHVRNRLRQRGYLLLQRWTDPLWYQPARAGVIAPSTGVPSTGGTRASIVVLSCNRLEYLKTTIASLLATTNRADFELIVVDNGSNDGSIEFLRELTAVGLVDKLIRRSRNHGTSPGFNCGFAFADPSTDFLVKLDSDIKVLTPGWLPRFAAVFDAVPDVAALALNLANHLMLRVAPRETRGAERLINWHYCVAAGACMTIPRRVFERAGHFNEDYGGPYMPDDIDYFARLQRLGYDAYYPEGTAAYHRCDLDGRIYDGETPAKRIARAQSMASQREWVHQYDRGERDLRVWYPKYERCRFPPNERILELE